jgi:hypothetical protein
MRRTRLNVSLLALVLVTLAGCATSDEWENWKSSPAHFASTAHMEFSMRNRVGKTPQVRREDITAAREEGWWGKSVTVAQEAILER